MSWLDSARYHEPIRGGGEGVRDGVKVKTVRPGVEIASQIRGKIVFNGLSGEL